MFLLYHSLRGCSLPRRAILAKHCLARRNRHYCVDRAVFLNLSLLEDVGKFCFHTKGCCPKRTLFRSQNNYVTPVLVLFMLAAVSQSNSRFAVRTNIDCAVGGLCVDDSIRSLAHNLCPTEQDRVVCYVRFVLLLLIYSKNTSCG
jgi:hypothetical protein